MPKLHKERFKLEGIQCYADFEADLLRGKIIRRNVCTAVGLARLVGVRKGCQLGGLYPPEYPVHELSFARVSMTEDKDQSNCLFNNLSKIESIFLDIWINYSLS